MKYESLTILNDGFTQPDEQFLRHYKFSDGLGFPKSYIDFSIKYGWGRLCGLFLVYIPLVNSVYPDSWQIQHLRIRNFMTDFYSKCSDEEDKELYEPDASLSLAMSAIPFAMGENGEYLVWDIRNRSKDSEFPIFVINSRFSGIRYAGNNLFEFIYNCTNLPQVKNTLGSGYKPLPLTFEPLKLFIE
jgi:hypothetical protein